MNETQDKLRTALLRATELMIDNNLGHWRLDMNNKRSSLAETFHSKKTIFISKHFAIVSTKAEFEGVVLHEITHALLGNGKGHGREFTELCKKISPDDTYARSSVNVPLRKYVLTCPECGHSGSSNRHANRYCGICWKANKTIKFNVEDNVIKVKKW